MSWFAHETKFVKALKQKFLHPPVKHNVWSKGGISSLAC